LLLPLALAAGTEDEEEEEGREEAWSLSLPSSAYFFSKLCAKLT
jgi:hypothetical protein